MHIPPTHPLKLHGGVLLAPPFGIIENDDKLVRQAALEDFKRSPAAIASRPFRSVYNCEIKCLAAIKNVAVRFDPAVGAWLKRKSKNFPLDLRRSEEQTSELQSLM